MNRRITLALSVAIGLVMTALAMVAPSRALDADDFRPLFNGKNLDGWEASHAELWSVHDAMIIGKQQRNQLKKNAFLATKEKYSDFILKASVRLVKDEGNSGIQFRSVIHSDGTARGYQADVAKGFWGLLLEEGSPKRLIIKRPARDAMRKVNPDGWNDYVITAKGHHITLELNGIKSVDLDDPRGDLTGVIALQLHVGPAMEVQFKDIAIKELN
jgi:hypothetical protein